MAQASTHHKQMEDLMGSEVWMPGVKDWQLQCIDDSANSVDNATGQQPEESTRCQGADDRSESQDTGPSHTDI